MAQILTDYDLSLGDVSATVVTSADDVSLSWKSTSVTDPLQVVVLNWMVQVDSEDYHPLKDEHGRNIVSKLKSNVSGSVRVFGINGANLRIDVVPFASAGSDGTLNLWATNG